MEVIQNEEEGKYFSKTEEVRSIWQNWLAIEMKEIGKHTF